MTERIVLKYGDVVSVDDDNDKVDGCSTLKVSELLDKISDELPSSYDNWLIHTGVCCEVLLMTGGGWVKGKARLICEFIPDEKPVVKSKRSKINFESESPLNDLREQLDL